MVASISIAVATLAAVAVAGNRVFGGLGNSACQECLATVEAACRGTITSSQFNDCFCDADGDAWAALENCLTAETDCDPTRESVLGYYGAHCFAWKDDAEGEFCVDASQDDELKMSVADSFCDEFITLSSSSEPTTTTVTEGSSSKQTTESRSETTESETTTSVQETTSAATSATEAQQTTSQDLPSSTSTAADVAPTKSDDKASSGEGSSDNDDRDDNDSNAGSNLTSVGVPGLVALALWAGYMLSS
ncbi:hypothetical protein EDB81DRAFT_928999 [Dactylonectria macrodidyma]|uniref:Extracellular membrane protein CFEM domain-containing protein n=1 Tax=Dactylonectria macrodidyma TaxID=307937 RepID=A0A9P9FAN5_9HYPO|nr:hypothetical protein EDB81DRAFT_928999 [Dactylonectria macrodidyma]